MGRKVAAEFIGTFWLVLGGCGSAVLAAAFPNVGIGLLGRCLRVRPHRPDHGLRDRPHLGLPSESRGLGRTRRPADASRPPTSCRTSSPRSRARSPAPGVLLPHRQRQERLRPRGRASPRTATARTRRAATRSWPCLVAEVVMTFMFLMIILGSTDAARAVGLRPDRDRPRPHAHPPDRHPRHEHLGQPGPQHRARLVRRRLGDRAALALLGRADHRRGARGLLLQVALRKGLTASGSGRRRSPCGWRNGNERRSVPSSSF